MITANAARVENFFIGKTWIAATFNLADIKLPNSMKEMWLLSVDIAIDLIAESNTLLVCTSTTGMAREQLIRSMSYLK